jgi:hypothetical protein
MNINAVFSRNLLPDNILDVLSRANIFYSDSYFQYLFRVKIQYGIISKPVYLYSDNHILLVNLHSKYIFNFASLPVEYLSVNDNNSENASLFLDACMRYLRYKFHIQWTGASNASALFQVYPSFSQRIPFGSHIIDLTETKDILWSKIHPKHRNSIQRASGSEIKIQFGGQELLEDYMILDAQTWKRSAMTGSSKDAFNEMLTILRSNSLVCLASKDAVPQCGAIFIFNEVMSYNLFAATKDHPEPGSMNLLHWQAILHMKNSGIKKYSFVGCRINEDIESKYHNLQRFKERFGGQLFTGFMFKVVFKKTFFSLYSLLLRLRGRSSDPIEQEIHKWSDLNK